MTAAIKRQVLPPGLWVVATPIGNLEDLSSRAIQALSEADAILCEDTRRTSQLMSALGISKRLERLDAHAGPGRIEEVARRLADGASYALVSDAGTPGISDPGARLVARARELGVRLTPLPGPSAPVTLLSVAGFEVTAFVFRGFFPRQQKERERELKLTLQAAKVGLARAYVWFESPERIEDLLAFLAGSGATGVRLVAGKELTKLHERIFAGSAGDVLDAVRTEIRSKGVRGEWCVAVLMPSSEFQTEISGENTIDESSDWVKALHCLLNARVSASEAAKQVSQHFGVARNRAYKTALLLSSSAEE